VQEGHLPTGHAADQLFAVSAEHEHQDRGCRKYTITEFETKTAIAGSFVPAGLCSDKYIILIAMFVADEQVRMLEPVRGECGGQAL